MLINTVESHSSAGREHSLNPFMRQKSGIEGSCIKVDGSIRVKAVFHPIVSFRPAGTLPPLRS